MAKGIFLKEEVGFNPNMKKTNKTKNKDTKKKKNK